MAIGLCIRLFLQYDLLRRSRTLVLPEEIGVPYQAEISRTNPSCFLFLVDQSSSMKEAFSGGSNGGSKAQGVADAVNSLLQNLVTKCTKSDGIRDYYHVGVIGYGGNGVAPAFGGSLARRELVPISLVGNSPIRVEQKTRQVSDGRGGMVDRKFNAPIWFEPTCGGGTPMCAALKKAETVLKPFLAQYPYCYPPIVINISDGESSDGNPDAAAKDLTLLKSDDGNVMLFNLHVSSYGNKTVEYPDRDDMLEDDYAKDLFRISSLLTSYMRKVLSDEGYLITEKSRGFAFNADFIKLIKFLDIGTRPSNLR